MAQQLSKPRATKGAKAKSVKDKAEEVETVSGKLPNKKTVVEFAKKIGTLQSEMASKRGEIGAMIKAGETDHNIHRGAFRKAVAYAKMDDAKFADEWRHLTSYLLAMGKIPQGDLFLDESESPAEKATFGDRKV